MSDNTIEQAFEEWKANSLNFDRLGKFEAYCIQKAFAAGAEFGRKETVKIIKEGEG